MAYLDDLFSGARGYRRQALMDGAGQPIAPAVTPTPPMVNSYTNDSGMGPVIKPTALPPVAAPVASPVQTAVPTPAPAPVPGPTNATVGASALQNFSDSAGMHFLEDNGNRMINNNQAAKGMLQSGATLKGVEDYANGLHSQYLNNYMNQIMDWSKLGLGAAGILAGAGNYSLGNSLNTGTSSGSGSSMPGILPGIQDKISKSIQAGGA